MHVMGFIISVLKTFSNFAHARKQQQHRLITDTATPKQQRPRQEYWRQSTTAANTPETNLCKLLRVSPAKQKQTKQKIKHAQHIQTCAANS